MVVQRCGEQNFFKFTCERLLFPRRRRTGLCASREQLHCVGFSSAFKERHQIAQCRFYKCMSKIATQLFVGPQVKSHHAVFVPEGRRSHMPVVQRGDDPDLKSHFVFFIQRPQLSVDCFSPLQFQGRFHVLSKHSDKSEFTSEGKYQLGETCCRSSM